MNDTMYPCNSIQTDRFVHDRLPPHEQRAEIRFDLPELRIADQANLVDVLLGHIETRGFMDKPFLRSDKITLTYADASDRINRIAQVLTEDFGLVPGNRVLLRGGNSIGMALAWLGVVKAGMIAVATMPLLRAKELGEVIEKAQIHVALCDAMLMDELSIAKAQTSTLTAVVPFNLMNDAGSLAVLSSQKDGHFKPCLTAADDVAMMAFTSGTTGKPKAAVHTHRDVLAACQAWPHHVLEAMVRLINETHATIVYTAPTFYRQMAPFAKQAGTPTLRICVSAGEALPDATRQLWKDATGIEMLDGIGATEMFHIFISSRPADVRRGAIGKVVPGYTAKVVDDQGIEVPLGTVGKLAIIGPTSCKYLDDARQTNYVKDGWNYPGDAFVQDADGYFFFQARADDMIKTSGYRVSPSEIEEAAYATGMVRDAVALGVEEVGIGHRIVLIATAVDGILDTTALLTALRQALPLYMVPSLIDVRDELPRSPNGKFDRNLLKAQVSA